VSRYKVILTLALLSFMASPAGANIYLKVDGPGQFTVTNSPSDTSFVKVMDTATGEEREGQADRIQQAVERAEGRYRIPRSLIYSIIKAYSNNQQGLVMPLPPGYLEEHGDTVVNRPEKNILVSTRFFRDMLKRYEGNMALTLAAVYAGPESVDEVEGVPTEPQAQQFVRDVRSSFDKFEQRSAVIYTYRDKNGTLHVVNIR
jgi:soluble lytic murein transglycosylase-like protein